MQHIIDPIGRFEAILVIPYVALDQAEILIRKKGLNITTVTGSKIIEANHLIILPEQSLTQVAANKSGTAGDEDSGVSN